VCVCVCAWGGALVLCVAWFRNYMQSSTANKVMKNVDCYRCMHDIAVCHV